MYVYIYKYLLCYTVCVYSAINILVSLTYRNSLTISKYLPIDTCAIILFWLP